MSKLSRDQIEALAQVSHRLNCVHPERCDQTLDEQDYADADALAPTVAAMLSEARAEVVRDVEGDLDHLDEQAKGLEVEQLAAYMVTVLGRTIARHTPEESA